MAAQTSAADLAEPPKLCALCPRLVDFRELNRAKAPDWYNGAVPSFGDPAARVLIVGLAPGLNGANRTGRPFTGDYAGELLYGTLLKFGFARGEYAARADDGLQLVDCMITNAVRCVPPENKPTPEEAATCRGFLKARFAALSEPAGDRGAGPRRARQHARRLRMPKGAVSVRARGAARASRRPSTLRQLPLLALQHQHRTSHGGDVPRGVCRGSRYAPRRRRCCPSEGRRREGLAHGRY